MARYSGPRLNRTGQPAVTSAQEHDGVVYELVHVADCHDVAPGHLDRSHLLVDDKVVAALAWRGSRVRRFGAGRAS